MNYRPLFIALLWVGGLSFAGDDVSRSASSPTPPPQFDAVDAVLRVVANAASDGCQPNVIDVYLYAYGWRVGWRVYLLSEVRSTSDLGGAWRLDPWSGELEEGSCLVPPTSTKAPPAESRIHGFVTAFKVAQSDAATVYEDLQHHGVRIGLHHDHWSVDYYIVDPGFGGGGPSYTIDLRSFEIKNKIYYQ